MHIDAETEQEARWEALGRLEKGCRDEFRGLNTTDMEVFFLTRT